MNRPAFFSVFAIPFLPFGVAWCQSNAADPHKQTLDRLDSITHQSEQQWRFHNDIPHPEDPAVNDSNWGVWKVSNTSAGEHSTAEQWTGTGVFRRFLEVPEKLNGYATEGSRVQLELRFETPASLILTVFSNGAILYRGGDGNLIPMLLTENAHPGQRFLVAARVVAGDSVQAAF